MVLIQTLNNYLTEVPHERVDPKIYPLFIALKSIDMTKLVDWLWETNAEGKMNFERDPLALVCEIIKKFTPKQLGVTVPNIVISPTNHASHAWGVFCGQWSSVLL